MSIDECSTRPPANAGLLLAWASNLGAIGLSMVVFFCLAKLAMERDLLLHSARQQQQLEQGWRWELERRSDLVGRSATGLENLDLEQGQLSGYRGLESGFLSLNFRGHRVDAKIHHLLDLRIWLEQPATLGIFFTEKLGGPVISTAAIELQAGWQRIELDLANRDWQTNTYLHQKRVSGPEPTTWGGDLGVISSLRIHPSMQANNAFRIDWIRLLPDNPTPWALRSEIQLASLELPSPEALESAGPAPLLLLPEKRLSVEQVLAFRDRINLSIPSASLLPGPHTHPGLPEARNPRHPWLTLATAILAGLIGLAATLVRRPRLGPRVVALAQLAGLLALFTLLLTWPDSDLSEDPVLALNLALLVALFTALLWQQRSTLTRGIILPSSSWWETAKLAIACLVPLLLIVLFYDQNGLASPPQLLQRFGIYLIWATLQQALLCILLLGIMERLKFRPQAAILIASILFALTHFPNFALMAGTLILARLCLWLYQRHNSLLPGIALHALLGSLYLELMPVTLLRSGAIGERFFF